MTVKYQPEWVERRANVDPETGARQKRMLVIGVDAIKIASAFARLMPDCHIESATRADHAIMALASGHFDATLVDCRGDERFHRLAVVAARQFKQGRVALLASDHFLPDEKAVLDNLDIFGSSDDSAVLLASLRLETKTHAAEALAAEPEVRNTARENSDFESALRAELEALQNRAGPPSAAMDLNVGGASARATAVEQDSAQDFEHDALQTAEAEAGTSRLDVENARQSPSDANFDFLTAMTLELADIGLVEAAPLPRAEEEAGQKNTAPPQSEGRANLDLFGYPVSEPPQAHFHDAATPLFAVGADAAADPDDLDLFNVPVKVRAISKTEEPDAHSMPETAGKESVSADSAGSLDLFGFLVSEPDENPLFDSQAGPATDAFGHASAEDTPDLFSALSPLPGAAGSALPAPEAAQTLDFFAAVRSQLQEIQLSQAQPKPSSNAADAAAESAAVSPASDGGTAKWGEPKPGVGQPRHAPQLKIDELAEPAVKTTLLRSTSWLAHLLPRLTPVYSLVYKNLALVLLGALFTAFVAFGVMIVFFLTSNKWSAPITLSRGHELVVKVERELSDLNVRKNQVSEQIEDAKKNLNSAQDELRRVHSLGGMIEGTISAEIKNRGDIKSEIETHTSALRSIAAQYGDDSLNPEFKGNLAREFDRRLINRNIFEAGKLAQLEAAHRTALIRNEIAGNEVEISRLNATLTALQALSGHVEGSAAPVAGTGGVDLVPLLNQVIEVRKGAAEAASELKAAETRGALLSDSLETLEASIAQIQSTPLARAISENITVLFVPYENAGQYEKGNILYSCAIGIFFCSEAGKVGQVIEGETVATHPFFNKPVRGSFVEAQLTDQDAAKKEILHVKRRPLFF
jgi:hypothetical protein